MAKTDRKEQKSSIACSSRAGHRGRWGSIEIQDAGDEFADGDPQVAPKPPLQAGVILRAAEEIAHQLPEDRAAPQELHHARGHRAAQERSAIERRTMRAANSSSAQNVAFTHAGYFSGQPSASERPSNSPERMA